jgi:hypothetical protein
MTIEEWNQLRPGDFIQHPGTDTRYKVHALGKDTVDVEKDATENDIIIIRSRNLWIDPLLSPDDPYYPDITEYEPGDADDFEPMPLIPSKNRGTTSPA